MKVSSPVGDFPYTLERARIEGRRVVVEGRMGTWPARIELSGADARRALHLARWPLVGLALLLVLRALRR